MRGGGNVKPEKKKNEETKITLCGTIGYLPLRGRCPKRKRGKKKTKGKIGKKKGKRGGKKGLKWRRKH